MSAVVVSVSAILLAAGESTRMGQQKALFDWLGTTLIEYQLGQLAAVDGITEIIVVTGHEPDAITDIVAHSTRASTAHNGAYKTGKVSSILTGLRAISDPADVILLLAVDQPRSCEIHRTLISAHVASGAAITLPALRGHRGHPLLFSRELLPELLQIREESQGVRALLQRHNSAVNVVEIGDPSINLDLNRREDVSGPLS